MYMIYMPTYFDGLALKLRANSAEVTMELTLDGFIDQRLPVFGTENKVHIALYE